MPITIFQSPRWYLQIVLSDVSKILSDMQPPDAVFFVGKLMPMPLWKLSQNNEQAMLATLEAIVCVTT